MRASSRMRANSPITKNINFVFPNVKKSPSCDKKHDSIPLIPTREVLHTEHGPVCVIFDQKLSRRQVLAIVRNKKQFRLRDV